MILISFKLIKRALAFCGGISLILASGMTWVVLEEANIKGYSYADIRRLDSDLDPIHMFAYTFFSAFVVLVVASAVLVFGWFWLRHLMK